MKERRVSWCLARSVWALDHALEEKWDKTALQVCKERRRETVMENVEAGLTVVIYATNSPLYEAQKECKFRLCQTSMDRWGWRPHFSGICILETAIAGLFCSVLLDGFSNRKPHVHSMLQVCIKRCTNPWSIPKAKSQSSSDHTARRWTNCYFKLHHQGQDVRSYRSFHKRMVQR
jgi:hypothetical protein